MRNSINRTFCQALLSKSMKRRTAESGGSKTKKSKSNAASGVIRGGRWRRRWRHQSWLQQQQQRAYVSECVCVCVCVGEVRYQQQASCFYLCAICVCSHRHTHTHAQSKMRVTSLLTLPEAHALKIDLLINQHVNRLHILGQKERGRD